MHSRNFKCSSSNINSNKIIKKWEIYPTCKSKICYKGTKLTLNFKKLIIKLGYRIKILFRNSRIWVLVLPYPLLDIPIYLLKKLVVLLYRMGINNSNSSSTLHPLYLVLIILIMDNLAILLKESFRRSRNWSKNICRRRWIFGNRSSRTCRFRRIIR